MDRSVRAALVALCACVSAVSYAAETQTYTYDVHGRLTQVQAVGGPANNVVRSYQYDATDNRTLLIVSGSSAGGTVTISAQGAVANATNAGVVIGVNISGSPPPTGMVTFTENGLFLGSAFIYDGQATVLLEGFAHGTHTIVATYSGDGANAPATHAFTIKVQSLSWLPAVLEILLSD